MDSGAQGRTIEDVSELIDVPPAADLEESYLHLLKLCLTGLGSPQPITARPGRDRAIFAVPINDLKRRVEGVDWPIDGYTMVGMKRLNNVQACVEDVIENGIPGDLIETGVWRGGTTIFMRALLKAHRVADRTVFVADSFRGLPPPDPDRWPADEGSRFHEIDFLRVPLERVEQNFHRFGMLDDQVRFVEGWFQDTLPTLKDRTWSVIRLDGDMYESTMVGLESLYPGLSPGGYLIVDDYGAVEKCKRAVDDYREANGIEEEIRPIDWTGVYWQKPS
jgi:O-methyltransferase